MSRTLRKIQKYARPSFFRASISSMRGVEKTIFFVALCLFFLSSAFLIGRTYYANTAAVPVSGGMYTEGVAGQPVLINPILSRGNEADRDIAELVYSGLLKSDGRGGVQKDLVEQYYVSDNGLEWTLHLKNNVYWHDGERFDADDVIFTIATAQDPDAGSPFLNSWQGVVAERISALEVRLYLRTPYAPFEENLKELKIIPRHIYGGIPVENLRLAEFRLEPVGTGPYSFSGLEKRRDGFITSYALARYPHYHGARSYIDTIRFRFYQNEEELVTAFNKREIDGFGIQDPDTLSHISVPHRIVRYAMPRYFAIFFNPNLSLPLSEHAVRRALDGATDKHSLTRFIFGEYAEVANGPVVRGMLGYDATAEGPAYDPETAVELLEGAGWIMDEEGERMRVKDGGALSLRMLVPDTPVLRRTAELVRDNWKRVGISVDIIIAPLSEITREHIRVRSYDMLLFGNIVNFNTDLFAFWHSSQRLHPGLNLSLFQNERVDTLIEANRRELDREARVAHVREAVSLIREDVPAVFLFAPDYIYVANNRVRGMEGAFILTSSERFAQAGNWYMREARVFE